MTSAITIGMLSASADGPVTVKALRPLQFGLGFTPGTAVALLIVGVRPRGGLWRMVLPSPIVDNDGEIRCSLGSFPEGADLEVRFDVSPISGDVQRLAAGVIQGSVLTRAREKSGLKRGEEWSEKFTYTVE